MLKMKHVALLYLLSSCLQGQNVVTDWAKIVQPAVNTPPKAPAYQMVQRAVIQIAVYDAVMAIEGGYKPFIGSISSSPEQADVRVAAATAAWRTARSRVDPSQVSYLDTQYTAYLANTPLTKTALRGVVVGERAAAAILERRANDGFNKMVLYECSANPPPIGEFEPDGGCGTQPVGANIGEITPFTFQRQSRFRPTGPDPLTSIAYSADFTATKEYGRADSAVRTPEQTDIAWFWQGADLHAGLVSLAVDHGLSVRDAARFFALVYTAAADANIAGYEAKYHFRSWRPRSAIPRADADDNPDTEADTDWKPLISVNHPEYPSAHLFSTGAIADSVARFFGTSKITWTLTADKAAVPKVVQTERTYSDLDSMLHEIYNARIWAGLHWFNSVSDGAKIGRNVASHVYSKYFLPNP
jgi:PAP2 superfamily